MSSDSSKPRNREKVGDLVQRNKELYMKGPIVLFRVEGDNVVYYFDHEMPPKRYRSDIATEQEKLMWDAIVRRVKP